jgi:hypothetical protein
MNTPRGQRFRSRCARRGLSLMEAMLSLAILGGALAAIGELIRLGARAAEEARDLTKAQLICDSIMGEVVAGIAKPTAATRQECPTDPGFVYTLQTASASVPDLLHVKLTIERQADIKINNPRGLKYSIERMLPDPNSQTFLASYAAGSPEPAKVDFSGAFAAGLSNMLGGAAGGASGGAAGGSGGSGGAGGGATGGAGGTTGQGRNQTGGEGNPSTGS